MISLTKDQTAVVFLDSIEKLEYKHKKAILELYKNPSDIFIDNRPIEKYFSNIGKEQTAKKITYGLFDEGLVKESVERAVFGADRVITYCDADYPKELLNTPTPPLCLYAVGNVNLLKKTKVGIVGSRKTLNQYLKVTEEISQKLSTSDIIVVTGIAEGGDYSAIKGAVQSGNLISVLAGDISNIQSSKNRDTVNKILSNGGLILSEHPYPTIPQKYFYPIRNRIIAGLSLGVLIVSGELSSGARHTAEYALGYGREVLCLPYGLGVLSGELCKSLIKNGAIQIENAEELSEALGLSLNLQKETNQLTENEKAIYKLIKEGVSQTDMIADELEIPIFEIISALGMLELKGFISKDSDGSVSAIK